MIMRYPAVLGLLVPLVIANPAYALLAGLPNVTETPGIASLSIAAGGTDTLTLHITSTPGTNSSGVFGGGTVTFNSGDGQTFSTAFSPNGVFSHTFTYSTAGIYLPTWDVEATVFSNANAGYEAQFLNLTGVHDFGTLQVGAVPEASTWVMMILGFAAVGCTDYRRRARSAATAD
jgi:hypothetical protein